MPTPFQILADPVFLLIMAMYLVLMIWEAFFPARRLPPIPFWRCSCMKEQGMHCTGRNRKGLLPTL